MKRPAAPKTVFFRNTSGQEHPKTPAKIKALQVSLPGSVPTFRSQSANVGTDMEKVARAQSQSVQAPGIAQRRSGNKSQETSSRPKTVFSRNVSGHEHPNMASKINVLLQKRPARAKLLGPEASTPPHFSPIRARQPATATTHRHTARHSPPVGHGLPTN
jgi:hypothetical protein